MSYKKFVKDQYDQAQLALTDYSLILTHVQLSCTFQQVLTQKDVESEVKRVRIFWSNKPATDLAQNIKNILGVTYAKHFAQTGENLTSFSFESGKFKINVFLISPFEPA